METTQGKVVGIIYPPPDIRAIIDKTAQFVSRNGRSFERKISGEAATAKFSFLKSSDPYNAYYEFKVDEFTDEKEEDGVKSSNSVGSSIQAGVVGSSVGDEQSLEKAEEASSAAGSSVVESGKHVGSGKVEENGSVVEKRAVENVVFQSVKNLPKEKPEEEMFRMMHPSINGMDLDIIRLTAKFGSVRGKEFLDGLKTREIRNVQFEFLKPSHALFGYFTSLLESYHSLLFGKDMENRVMKKLVNGLNRMDVLDRCVHRLEWNRMEEEKRNIEKAEQDADRVAYLQIDWHDFVIVEVIDFNAQVQEMNDDAGDDMEMEEVSEINVVQDYVPQAYDPNNGVTSKMAVDGKNVEANDINEHMRILLMDPKWRQENQKRLDKQKETSYAAGDSIAQNLQRFADKRVDIFASSAEEEKRLLAATQSNPQQPPPGPPAGYAPPPHLQQYPPNTSMQPPSHMQHPPPSHMQHPPPSHMQQPPPGHIQQPPPGHMQQPPPGHMQHPPQGFPPTQGHMPPPHGFLPPRPHMGAPPGAPIPHGFPPGVHTNGPPGAPMNGPPGAAMGVPPGVHMAPGEGPDSKRQRTDGALMDAADFAKMHPGLVELLIQIPNESCPWPLNGQVIKLDIDIHTTMKDLKCLLSTQLGDIPPNKFQLKTLKLGFLKDNRSAAYYNFVNGLKLDVQLRQRGGRR